MERSELLALIVDELTATLGLVARPIQESDLLLSLPNLDSLRLARIAAHLERSTSALFDDEALFSARTVGDVVDCFASALREAA